MSLLCRFGLHRPRGIPRWNDGLYFATCEGCGRDLVRTAFQRWHVPKGYRVVWSDRPPASRPEVALVSEESRSSTPAAPQVPAELANRTAAESADSGSPPGQAPGISEEPAGPSAPTQLLEPDVDAPAEPAVGPVAADSPLPPDEPPKGRLPIQEVLAHLNAEDAEERMRGAAPVPEAPPRSRRPAWDFMDDDPLEEDLPSGLRDGRGAAGASTRAGPDSVAIERGGAPPSPGPALFGERWQKVRSAVRNFSSGPAEPRPVLVVGLAFGLAVAVAAALALYSSGLPERAPAISAVGGGRVEGAETEERPDPFAASAPAISGSEAEPAGPPEGVAYASGEEIAYVAASLLSCREAPALQARRIRNLPRGQEVRILGYDGAWASLAYRGGQCWAQAQYLSPVPTL